MARQSIFDLRWKGKVRRAIAIDLGARYRVAKNRAVAGAVCATCTIAAYFRMSERNWIAESYFKG
jgi:hypothetical protein